MHFKGSTKNIRGESLKKNCETQVSMEVKSSAAMKCDEYFMPACFLFEKFQKQNEFRKLSLIQ